MIIPGYAIRPPKRKYEAAPIMTPKIIHIIAHTIWNGINPRVHNRSVIGSILFNLVYPHMVIIDKINLNTVDPRCMPTPLHDRVSEA